MGGLNGKGKGGLEMKEETENGNGNGNGRLFRFNREITLGNLLQLASFVVALVAMWTSMDKRPTAVELRARVLLWRSAAT